MSIEIFSIEKVDTFPGGCLTEDKEWLEQAAVDLKPMMYLWQLREYFERLENPYMRNLGLRAILLLEEAPDGKSRLQRRLTKTMVRVLRLFVEDEAKKLSMEDLHISHAQYGIRFPHERVFDILTIAESIAYELPRDRRRGIDVVGVRGGPRDVTARGSSLAGGSRRY